MEIQTLQNFEPLSIQHLNSMNNFSFLALFFPATIFVLVCYEFCTVFRWMQNKNKICMKIAARKKLEGRRVSEFMCIRQELDLTFAPFTKST